jgi:hypothetical protein
MHISKDKIDRLFSEKLVDHEVQPRKQAWEKLENRLQQKKKKKFPLWQKMSIAASLLLVLFAGGIGFYKNSIDSTISQTNKIAEKPIIKPTEKTIEVIRPEKLFAVEQGKTHENVSVNATKTQQIQASSIKETIIANQIDSNTESSIAKLEQPETKYEDSKAEEIAHNNPPVEAKNNIVESKEEDLTIVFTLANFENNTIAENTTETTKEKKPKYISRFFKQLVNAKNGDRVDWNDMGFKPAKIFARAEYKLKGTKEEINDSYQTIKNKTVL